MAANAPPHGFNAQQVVDKLTHDQMWGAQYKTVGDRFPNLGPQELWDVFWLIYVRDGDFTVKVVDADGKSLTSRSYMNLRSNTSVTLKYSKEFLSGGLRIDFRSRMICHPPELVEGQQHSPDARQFLCGGTVNAAILHSLTVDPDNKYCVLIKEQGFKRCIDLKRRVPDDCKKWLKDEGNAHMTGFQYSVVEYLEDIPSALADWEEYKARQEPPIRVQNCPARGDLRYDKLYENYIIAKYGKQFGSKWFVFNLANGMQKDLVSLGLFQQWKDDVEGQAHMLHPFFSDSQAANAIIIRNSSACTSVATQFLDAHSPLVVTEILRQMLRFMYPMDLTM